MTTTMGRGHTWQRKSLAILAAVALFASLVTVFAPRAEAEHNEYFPQDPIYNDAVYWENYLNGHDGVDNSECEKDNVESDADYVADADYRLVIVKKGASAQANRLYWNVSAGDVLPPGVGQGYSHLIVCTNTPYETTTTTEQETTTTTEQETTTTTEQETTTTTGYPEPGKIVVWKYVTEGSDQEQEFWFETDFSFGPNPLSHEEMGMSGQLDPGVYSVTESLPEGWELEDASCDDGSDPSAIDVSEGETVTCTFLNTEVDDQETTTTTEQETTTTTEQETTTTTTDPYNPGLPEIDVTKTAGVDTVEEPGENVTFTVVITNTSATVPVAITSLEDDVYGVLAGDADCEVGTVLAPLASCSFDFVGFVGGDDGDEHQNTVTVNGEDESKNPVDADDDASVDVLGTEVKDVVVLPFTGIPSDYLLVVALILMMSGAGMVAMQRRNQES